LKTTPQKVSALIITYNEMGYIQQCVESVAFADEIIVVDSYSNDGTYEYLKQLPHVTVLQHHFENFTAQKSFALRQATNDWVLFLDADEVVTPELKNEILHTLNAPSAVDAYWCYRKFIFKNGRLRFSGWQTDKNYRLFRKSKARFADKKLVHETLKLNGTSSVFKEKLNHFCYKNYEDYRSKMVHYGYLRGQEEFLKGKHFSYAKMIFKPLWRFFYNYVIRLGFLDLNKGIVICYLNALSVYTRYYRLKELEQTQKPVFTSLLGDGELANQF